MFRLLLGHELFVRASARCMSIGDFLGVRLWIASPEDVVLSKLEWAQKAGSERQLRDVRGILAAKPDALDSAYILRWVTSVASEVALDLDAELGKPAARHLRFAHR